MTLRIAIVDDEPPARRLLREMLQRHEDVEVVAEFPSGREAVEGLAAAEADVLFLDVQLPDIDGFRVLAELAGEDLPVVVFTTAHQGFALKAFEVEAIDYVLKPFDADRLDRALLRARARLASEARPDYAALLKTLEQMGRVNRYITRLPVKSGERIVLLPVADIVWIEAAGKLSRVHAGGEPKVVRETLGSLEASLDPERFLRISRYALVNLDRVREIQPWFHGDFVVVVDGGDRVRSTRGYREGLERLLRREPDFARKG